jgi:hypothetical protein
MIRRHMGVDKKRSAGERKGQWHSSKTLARYRKARNKANERAHQSRKRNW